MPNHEQSRRFSFFFAASEEDYALASKGLWDCPKKVAKQNEFESKTLEKEFF